MNQLRDQAANVVHVVEPGDEVLAGELVAVCEMAIDRIETALRELPEGRGIEVGPVA